MPASRSLRRPSQDNSSLRIVSRTSEQLKKFTGATASGPRERPDRKPSLEEVMSHATIEKKVQDYLRNSELLEQEWQKPITPEQLQAEMDRMAQHSKQPEVLRELFAALGNDPFVIAECLARPVLTGRLIADLSGQHQTKRLESVRTVETQMPKKVAAIETR